MSNKLTIFGNMRCPYTRAAVELAEALESGEITSNIFYEKHKFISIENGISDLGNKYFKKLMKNKVHQTIPKVFIKQPNGDEKFLGGFDKLSGFVGICKNF